MATLNCSTDLAVERIQWLDQKGLTVTKGMEPFLELTTEAIDSQFTCQVDNMFGSQNRTVTLKVAPHPMSTPLVPSAITAVFPIIIVILFIIASTVAICMVAIVR